MTAKDEPTSAAKLTIARIATISQLAFIQMLPKPTKKYSVSMLPITEDLRGEGWVKKSEQSWRIGVAGDGTSPKALRAKAIKSTRARREFVRELDLERMLFSVAPYASDEDAGELINEFEENTHKMVTRVLNLDDFTTFDQVDSRALGNSKCVEYRWDALGRVRVARAVAARVKNVYFNVTCQKYDVPTPWPFVFDMAILQSNKVRQVIEQE
jgi:hypothetical protein